MKLPVYIYCTNGEISSLLLFLLFKCKLWCVRKTKVKNNKMAIYTRRFIIENLKTK